MNFGDLLLTQALTDGDPRPGLACGKFGRQPPLILAIAFQAHSDIKFVAGGRR